MLRYGLAVALTPDHLIHFVESLPEAAERQNIDAVIVDAAMLRGAGVTVDVRAVESWQLPTVWLDDSSSANVSNIGHWATLTLPVVREQLLKALFECLNPPSSALAAAKKIESNIVPKPRPKKAKPTEAPATDGAQVIDLIELVEVVDDEPDNG